MHDSTFTHSRSRLIPLPHSRPVVTLLPDLRWGLTTVPITTLHVASLITFVTIWSLILRLPFDSTRYLVDDSLVIPRSHLRRLHTVHLLHHSLHAIRVLLVLPFTLHLLHTLPCHTPRYDYRTHHYTPLRSHVGGYYVLVRTYVHSSRCVTFPYTTTLRLPFCSTFV